jgi:hypothetical protein
VKNFLNWGLIVLSLFSHPHFASAQEEIKPIVSNYDLPIDSYDYNRMFKYTRELLTRKPVEDLLKKVFEKQLQVTPELAKKLNIPVGGIKQLSEHQFVLLLQMNEELWPMLDQYIKEVPNINLDSEKQVALRKVWREKFEKILNDPKVMKKFTKFNNPLEPRILQTANGSAGYKNLEFLCQYCFEIRGW